MNIRIRKPLSFSEIGRKDNQEDYLWPIPNTVSADNRIFLMCDGVGGQDSGEVASLTAATAIGEYLTKHPAENGVITKALFEEALAYGYDELDKVDTGAVKKMGTTMTCLALHEGGALMAHIGDSRIYHIRPSLSDENGRTGIIYQSADHSLVNDLLRVGEITEEEAANFPQKNVITRAMQPHLERRYRADIFNTDDIQAGDYFFLCSDGVLEQLTNDLLGAILSDASLDDQGKIHAIKAICDNNTRDNYTCWLIPIDSVEGVAGGVHEEEIVSAEIHVEEENSTIAPHSQPTPVARTKQTTQRQGSTKKSMMECLLGKWKMWPFLVIVMVVGTSLFMITSSEDNNDQKKDINENTESPINPAPPKIMSDSADEQQVKKELVTEDKQEEIVDETQPAPAQESHEDVNEGDSNTADEEKDKINTILDSMKNNTKDTLNKPS